MMDDPISRQAAIDEIMGQPPELHYPSWYAEQIKKLPSAKQNNTCEFCDSESSFCALNRPSVQSRNNGRWKRINDDVFADLFKRSECGKLPPIENSEWWSVFIGGFALGMKWVKGESDGRSDKQTGGD